MNDFSIFFRGWTKTVKRLLIVNSVFFIVQQFSHGWLEMNLGLIPSKVLGGLQLWRLVSYMFLHGSFLHFFMNMFTLWMFGKELEYVWGSKEFIKFYFLCGLGAGIFNTIFEPFSVYPIIGASGAIYGLLAAFAIVFPDSLIYLYGIFPMRAKHFVILLGVIEFFASFQGALTTIARLAHLGGMLTGYFYIKSYEFRSFLNHAFHKMLDLFIVKTSDPKVRKEQDVKKEDLSKEVDRILEKVLLHGTESLTEKEREIMRRYSTKKH